MGRDALDNIYEILCVLHRHGDFNDDDYYYVRSLLEQLKKYIDNIE